MRRIWTLVVFSGLIGARSPAQDVVAAAREDLDPLATMLRERHARPFWLHGEAELDRIVERARKRLAEADIEPDAALVELLRVIAFPGDGHTSLTWNSQLELFGDLPLRCAWFGGDLVVVRAADEAEPLLGGRILTIGGRPVADVLERVRPIVSCANESGFRSFSTRYLRCPGVLHGLGVTADASRVTMRAAKVGGAIVAATLSRRGPGDPKPAFRDALDETDPLPLHRQGGEDPLWFRHLKDADALYVRVAAIVDAPDESFARFTARVFEAVDRLDPKRIVIDLRGNGGGSGFLVLPFVSALLARPERCRRGRLAVLTDHRTFSAAILFCNQLETKTDAVFIGESPGDPPCHPGDPEVSTLPHTGIGIRMSTEFWATFPGDDRRAIEPELAVTASFEDLSAGRDPALDRALAWTPAPEPELDEPSRWVGRFRFSPGRVLAVRERDGRLAMEVSKTVYSGLRPVGERRFASSIPRLELELRGDGALRLHLPGGSSRELPRVDDRVVAPIDALYAGEPDVARALYAAIAERHAGEPCLLDNNLALEAILLLRRTGDTGKAKELLRIAIELNPARGFARRVLGYF